MPRVQDDFNNTMNRNNRSMSGEASSVLLVGKETSTNDIDMSLVKMLIILSRAGENGLTTRDLLKKFHSTGYGQTVLRQAVDKGYVGRIPTKREDKKGRGGSNVVINYITPAGKKHLKGLLDE